jgi:hypothetical protein
MKRILLCALLIGFFVLMRPAPASVAQDKPSSPWQTLGKDSKVLKLWETDLGPKVPQIAILQLSEERQKELESDPLKFYDKYDLFKPQRSDRDQGHAVFHLTEYKAKGKDPSITVAVHGPDTYSSFASFAVADIK